MTETNPADGAAPSGDPGFGRRLLAFFRTPHGRRILAAALILTVLAIGWQFMDRMPDQGTIELRWTESPPEWVSLIYKDDRGNVVRQRRVQVLPTTDRFRDRYEVSPGTYWVRVEFRQADRIRSVLRRLELPTLEPIVFFAEEIDTSP